MGLKYKLSTPDGVVHPNGSRVFRTPDAFASLAKVENCPCEDGVRRNAFATAEPEGFFVVPACVYVGKKTVAGRLVNDESGWRFEVLAEGRNAGLLKENA